MAVSPVFAVSAVAGCGGSALGEGTGAGACSGAPGSTGAARTGSGSSGNSGTGACGAPFPAWPSGVSRGGRAVGGGRGVKTGIYFLLRAGERSRWHRVDAVEMWHWHAGGPLELSISTDGRSVERVILGMDLPAGQRPQGVVPAHAWQAARPLDGWVLVGCTVSPAFEFAGFEMAPEGWEPG